MDTICYTAVRRNLAAVIDRVCNDQSPIVISRKRKPSVVMLPLAHYEALEETGHLLSRAANAKRLLEAIDSLDARRD